MQCAVCGMWCAVCGVRLSGINIEAVQAMCGRAHGCVWQCGIQCAWHCAPI
jgi:hypothetical protein